MFAVSFLLQNKCNVGYAFINMTEPCLIVPFYQVYYQGDPPYICCCLYYTESKSIVSSFLLLQTFNGKKWEKFNSEKVASLAYARIQGKSALIAHFQNSSLMNEDKRCRPILFHTDGPNAGDQVLPALWIIQKIYVILSAFGSGFEFY